MDVAEIAGKLTAAQVELCRHALGLNRSKEPYRNYFAASDGHDDLPDLLAMVEIGAMIEAPKRPNDYRIFHVVPSVRAHLKEQAG